VPAYGILKGGIYGCKEKGQKESQKEKKVSFELWGCGGDLNPPYSQATR
jgi:hypothetical protein